MVSAPLATNPGLMPKLPYDALRDLTPVINLTAQGFVISVHEKQPFKTVVELLEAAKKPGGDVSCASPGSGTSMHLVGQVINAEYQTRFVHIPYKGSGPAIHDAIGGQVPMIIDPITTSIGQIRQGRLRALAEVRDRLVDQLGGTLAGGSAEEFGAPLEAETERWVPIIRRLGL